MITPTVFPKSYQSVFRPGCFEFTGIEAPAGGADFEICSSESVSNPVGIKRLWTDDRAVVNVSPYLRGLFAPEPLCGRPAGMAVGGGRIVWCNVRASGYSSPEVPFTCGTEDADRNTILSAGPGAVIIREGERDEMSILAPNLNVKPSLVFVWRGVEYVDTSLPPLLSDKPVTMVVDADAASAHFAALTGAPASEMAEFTVLLTVEASRTVPELHFRRRYMFNRMSYSGRRLAWLNRYGMVDYYTFPAIVRGCVTGSRTGIDTPDGYLTTATTVHSSVALLSDPCSALEAEWLAELFSSPLVWLVGGTQFERVEVRSGEVVCSPLAPTVVKVVLEPFIKIVSRRF